jgi:hypothetical protein
VRAHFTNLRTLSADTRNVTTLTLSGVRPTEVVLDGQRVKRLRPSTDGTLRFSKQKNTWRQLSSEAVRRDTSLRKRPGLTGPINDAFMDSFLFVRPTRQPLNSVVGQWANSELAYATSLWRDVFRGDVPVKDDTALTDTDIRSRNLVLWGDPSSNAVLARIIKRLPMQWNARKLVVRGQSYDAAHHAPVLIFPNPLNPQRYVVLNSGIDFRSDGYGNNALQTPKLPDWSVIDLREPAGPRWPGRVANAGFFNEDWK